MHCWVRCSRGWPSDIEAEVSIRLWAERSRLAARLPELGPRGLLRGSLPDGLSAVYEAGSSALTVYDTRSSRGFYRVPAVDEIPWWELAAPLRPALHFALAGPTSHLVHAAVVGESRRGGVLLAGPGGSGKTTLALAAVERGMAYVGDDYVFLEHGVAWNLYRTAKVDAGADREKVVSHVSPGSLVEALPVRAVIVPTIRGGRTRLQRIGGAEALRALAPSTAFQMPFDRGAVLATLAQLVRQVPCFKLELGAAPGPAVSALEEVLSVG